MKLFLQDAPANLVEYLQRKLEDFPEHVEIHDKITFNYDVNSPESRWEQLVLAAQGARLYTNTENKNSPLYVGPLPVDGATAERLLIDLNYAYKQSQYIQSFGVTYIGRTSLNPRNILVYDHKKASERVDKALPEAIRGVLRDAPEDWWGSLAVCSTGNVEKLQALLNAMPDVIPMVLTDGSAAKVKFCRFEYVHLNEPKPGDVVDFRNGEDMRGRTNALSKKLAKEQTGDWVQTDSDIYVPEGRVFQPDLN